MSSKRPFSSQQGSRPALTKNISNKLIRPETAQVFQIPGLHFKGFTKIQKKPTDLQEIGAIRIAIPHAKLDESSNKHWKIESNRKAKNILSYNINPARPFTAQIISNESKKEEQFPLIPTCNFKLDVNHEEINLQNKAKDYIKTIEPVKGPFEKPYSFFSSIGGTKVKSKTFITPNLLQESTA